MQKVVFLFRRLLETITSEEGLETASYIAYDLGPYSEEVEGALEALSQDGYLTIKDKTVTLTSIGYSTAESLASAKPKAASALRSIVDLLETLTSNEIVLCV